MRNHRRTVNVLCTLGPASLDANTIRRLDERGVDLFRINLSHTPLDQVAKTIETIQRHSQVPICLDTEGAQVRTGTMAESVNLTEMQHVRLTPEIVQGNADRITLTPSSIFSELQSNHLITLDFDGVALLVLSKDANGVDAVVVNGGKVGSNKAVVISPPMPLPAITEKDREAVKIGLAHGIKHFALSFTNSSEDVRELRELAGPSAVIISKIESKRGVLNLDDILATADEILIDRGDLSREVPLENIPLLQKSIIRKAVQARVPVNVATNLLESMLVNRKPTRAELNDIVNTLLDGATGLVLAAETAVGKHPVEAVDMVLNLIARVRKSSEGYRIEDLLEGGPTQLPSLHGRQVGTYWHSRRRRTSPKILERLAAIEVSADVAQEIENLAHGVYSPLRGFMTETELNSVLDTHRLPGGDVWPVPIILQGRSQEFAAFQAGQSVRLIDSRSGRNIAVLQIEDKFELDRDSVARRWFDTNDAHHPGVQRLIAAGLTVLGGPIEYLGASSFGRSAYELTPAQVRTIFDIKGWTKVVAVQVADAGRASEARIIEAAQDLTRADGVLVQPTLAPLSSAEESAAATIADYEQFIQQSLSNAVLSVLRKYERFAGSREAVFNALCGKNFGCTHFVVGGFDGARELFESLGDIKISPVYLSDAETFNGDLANAHDKGGVDFDDEQIELHSANSRKYGPTTPALAK